MHWRWTGPEPLKKKLPNTNAVVWIRIGFNADLDPDPVFYLKADPDPGGQNSADPGGIRILVRLSSY